MRKILVIVITLFAFWAMIPWSSIGLASIGKAIPDFKLGLDLHGGVELDYLVDFSNMTDATSARKTQIIEDMKTILDGRVRRIGTTEPILNTAMYGDETHIIVQIPTPNSHDKLSQEDRKKKDAEFIQEAKAVIGQVIKIQFKEPRTEEEFSKAQNLRQNDIKTLGDNFKTKTVPFDAWAQKMADTYENVFSFKTAELQALAGNNFLTVEDLEQFFSITDILGAKKEFSAQISPTKLGERSGTSFVVVESLSTDDIMQKTTPIQVKMLFADNEPLRFKPAQGKNGKILDEKYLINTIPSPDPTTGQYVVSLVFNTEGQSMFGDITERNIGGIIAIFLGNNLLTAPHVSSRIDGNAIITPGGELDSKTWATQLSKNINEGIVPVGIYEHSEQTIGPNLGKTSLNQLILSGILGCIVICAFLLWRYRLSGIVAATSLILYIIILLAFVRMIGVTLTLSGVAGIILSIGIAIDSNILLLERVRDFLEQGKDMPTSLKLGFHEAWSAVWDSNLTGLFVGFILWWMGVSLVKGFGQMTVLGIVVSLLVVYNICNPLTIWLRNKIG